MDAVNKKGKLIIFSAPSGSGKTTLVHYIMTQLPEVAFSVSATSRAPRENEQNGVDYYFITVDDFRQKISQQEFVEWEEVYPDQYYGTLKSEVEKLRNEGKTVLFDVDVKGGLNIKDLYGADALAVFVRPPSIAVLEERLRNRSTESEESIRKRLDRAAYELDFEDKFDVVVINGDLDKSKADSLDYVSRFMNGVSKK
ncbi:MAG: guanylate kinase [Bacteroidales bacterium]|nr:guanylate kinase [Bacteroidales bacterium]